MGGQAFDPESEVVVVTGGSQGIGFAAVTALSARGKNVVAVSRSRERLDQAISSLPPGSRNRVTGISADVTNEDDVIRAVKEVRDRFGRIDVLINSAGTSMTARRRLVDSTMAEWRRLIDTNLTGTYLMCRESLPSLEERRGYILNVLSTAAFRAQEGVSLYAASKFGARALTEALVDEYSNTGVRITSVSPGPVDTTIWNHKEVPPSDEDRAKMMRPADIADIFLWLLDRPTRLHIRDITVTPWATADGGR